jgi:hypothetical protein
MNTGILNLLKNGKEIISHQGRLASPLMAWAMITRRRQFRVQRLVYGVTVMITMPFAPVTLARMMSWTSPVAPAV